MRESEERTAQRLAESKERMLKHLANSERAARLQAESEERMLKRLAERHCPHPGERGAHRSSHTRVGGTNCGFSGARQRAARFRLCRPYGRVIRQHTEGQTQRYYMRVAGFPAAEIRDAGFTAAELATAGFIAAEFKAGAYYAEEFKAAGFTAQALWQPGFPRTPCASMEHVRYTTTLRIVLAVVGRRLRRCGNVEACVPCTSPVMSARARGGLRAGKSGHKGVPTTLRGVTCATLLLCGGPVGHTTGGRGVLALRHISVSLAVLQPSTRQSAVPNLQ
jgi:hypothetical protein